MDFTHILRHVWYTQNVYGKMGNRDSLSIHYGAIRVWLSLGFFHVK